jgi:NAD(P)H-dependent FMN reductase
MKKILTISTSPRKGANADTAMHEVAEAARAAGAEVTELAFHDLKINYCLGCGFCKQPGNAGKCVQKDDMQAILDALQTCDGVAFSTGVYFGTVSAQAKTVVDRMYALFQPGPPPKHDPDAPKPTPKKLLVVMTEGMPRPDADKARAEDIYGYFGVAGCNTFDYLVIDGCRERNSTANNPDHLAAARAKGAWLAE